MAAMLAAFVCAASLVPQAPSPTPEARPANPWVTAAVRGPGLVQHVHDSPATGGEVSYHVYLPPDNLERDDRRYPVLYWLHGSGGGLPGIAPLAHLFEEAILRELIPPLLVVFPNGLANGMWCDSVDGRQPVETVLVGEIVPRIDRLFRTVAAREGRLVEGFSMGGYGALRLAFAHPDLFAAASSFGGGPLQRELVATPRADEARRQQVLREVYGGDMALFRQRSPWELASAHAKAPLPALRLRQVIGTADETLPANRDLHAHLEQLGIPHDYLEVEGVPHQALPLLRRLGDRHWAFYREVLAPVASK